MTSMHILKMQHKIFVLRDSCDTKVNVFKLKAGKTEWSHVSVGHCICQHTAQRQAWQTAPASAAEEAPHLPGSEGPSRARPGSLPAHLQRLKLTAHAFAGCEWAERIEPRNPPVHSWKDKL